MSRKKAKTPSLSSLAPFNPRAETVRRVLLALITALVVARPVVLGEDPGLLYSLSGTAGLTLSMLWLIAAVAWAAWQAWFRQENWSLEAIDLGWAGVAALVFASAIVAAHYRHPALLIGWEWWIFVLAFFLVRQLFRTEADVRGLLAAILATGVSLSAHAGYQHFYDLPRTRAQFTNLEQLREELARLHVAIDSNDPSLDVWRKRIEMDHVFATYAHPNGFAGYLALLLPAAVGWSAFTLRRSLGLQSAWGLGMALCTALIAAALWWTHSRGAILGVVLAGAATLVLYGRGAWWRWRRWLSATLAVALCLGLAAGNTSWGAMALDKATHSFGLRTEYWTATWRMISDHPWLGVGAGNFGSHYPRYMTPEAAEKVQDPHNFLLEIWATAGILALAVFLLTLGFLFRRWSRSLAASCAGQEIAEARGQGLRWDIYLGGIAGLLLGVLLRISDAPNVLEEGLLSAGRCLVWFLAYCLFAPAPWHGPSRSLAIMTGVAALLLNLCVSGGIAWPSVAQPLWIMAALALATGSERAPVGSWITGRNLLVRGAAFALIAATALCYLFQAFVPVTAAAADLATARRLYSDDAGPSETRNPAGPVDADRLKKTRAARLLAILKHVEDAQKADPGNVTSYLELAHWYGESARVIDRNDAVFQKAVTWARLAQKLDADSKEGFLAEYHLLKARAADPAADSSLARRLPAIFQAVVDRDPTEAALHSELAQLYLNAGEPARARLEAEQALRLDRSASTPARRLTPEQWEEMEKAAGLR